MTHMEVKGTAILSTRLFVQQTFGNDYSNWLEALPKTSQSFYTTSIDPSAWYPIEESYITPMRYIADFFYRGNEVQAGILVGTFSGDVTFKGNYKLFLLVASPWYLIKKASKVFTTYYMPCEIQMRKIEKNAVYMTIRRFPKMSVMLEYRIIGWCIKALEYVNCKIENYELLESVGKNSTSTEIVFHWS